MKLYLLKLIEHPAGYDYTRSAVVRVKSRRDARRLLAETHKQFQTNTPELWLDETKSSCEEVREHGNRGIVLEDFLAG